MDDEFPKTLNSALSNAAKVHGSITDLVKILGDFQADVAGLTPAMTAALAVMKVAPVEPVPVAAAKPGAIAAPPKTAAEKAAEVKPAAKPSAETLEKPVAHQDPHYKPHSSTPD
jgi:hypothetical protein